TFSCASAGVDGVFHPHYIDVHLGVAERLARPRLLVLKGGGGEVERVPLKDSAAYLWCQDEGRSEVPLPGVPGLAPLTPQSETPALVRAVWRGEAAPETVLATIHATIALALMALGRGPAAAEQVWAGRYAKLKLGPVSS